MNNKVVLLTLLSTTFLITGCSKNEKVTQPPKPDKKVEQVVHKDFFIAKEVPDNIQKQMVGHSYPTEPKHITMDNLRLINLKYWGFDNKSHENGVIIVNEDVSQDVCDIFKELYDKKYPIQRINLIDDYNAQDELSMNNNNTSAFCYREIAGTNMLSNHSFGRAIDINPLQNPQVLNSGAVSPEKGRIYSNRDLDEKGMIKKGDDCYNAFISRGWSWGGDWNNNKDYQHFEKEIRD